MNSSRKTKGILICVLVAVGVLLAVGKNVDADFVFGQIAPNKHNAAVTLLAFGPGPLMIAVEDHVHALKDKALVIVLERQNALGAQDVRPFGLHQVLHPGKELVGIERLVALE